MIMGMKGNVALRASGYRNVSKCHISEDLRLNISFIVAKLGTSGELL
jgi:hypothetical protein